MFMMDVGGVEVGQKGKNSPSNLANRGGRHVNFLSASNNTVYIKVAKANSTSTCFLLLSLCMEKNWTNFGYAVTYGVMLVVWRLVMLT